MRTLSTTVPFGFDFDTRRWIDAYRALGCVSCQFYRNPKNPPTPREARALAESAGLPFDSIHALFGTDLDPSSPDADHRAHCLRVYEDEARLALDLGCRSLVVHPSAYTADFSFYGAAEAGRLQRERWGFLDDFLRRLADVGARTGTVMLIENLPRNAPLGHDPVALAEHIRAVNSPSVRMCLDTGHAHLTGDLVPDLRAAAGVISYLHIHDNDREADQHLMPTDGTIDWSLLSQALRELTLDCPCMLEVFYDEDRLESLARASFARTLAACCAIDAK